MTSPCGSIVKLDCVVDILFQRYLSILQYTRHGDLSANCMPTLGLLFKPLAVAGGI